MLRRYLRASSLMALGVSHSLRSVRGYGHVPLKWCQNAVLAGRYCQIVLPTGWASLPVPASGMVIRLALSTPVGASLGVAVPSWRRSA